MKRIRTDVAIVGGGTAGLSARRAAKRAGASCLMIDAPPHGTTCACVGCMPSKLLIQAADLAHDIARAPGFGIRVNGEVEVDFGAVMERVRRERDRFVKYVLDDIGAMRDDEYLEGNARFIDERTLQIDDHHQVEAKAFVLATGSRPHLPSALDPFAGRVLFSEHVFELRARPKSMGIVGAGVVALELGQALRRLDVRVALFTTSDRLGPSTDPEAIAAIERSIGREITIHRARNFAYASEPEAMTVRWTDASGNAREERFEHLLVAAGRRPNVDALGLDHLALERGPRGVPVFDRATMQCGTTGIFIAGDADDERPVLHEASDQGRIAGENAACFPNVKAFSRKPLLGVVFSDPQIAVIGSRYSDLDLPETVIGEVDFGDQGRSRVMGKNAGVLRVYARRATGELMGAEIVGPRAEHLAHLLAWSVQQKLDVRAMLAMPFYHPVIEEGLRTALRDAASQLRIEPPPPSHNLDCGPGN